MQILAVIVLPFFVHFSAISAFASTMSSPATFPHAWLRLTADPKQMSRNDIVALLHDLQKTLGRSDLNELKKAFNATPDGPSFPGFKALVHMLKWSGFYTYGPGLLRMLTRVRNHHLDHLEIKWFRASRSASWHRQNRRDVRDLKKALAAERCERD
jgi:hypothetical protein